MRAIFSVCLRMYDGSRVVVVKLQNAEGFYFSDPAATLMSSDL
jgi:hypothetical protein